MGPCGGPPKTIRQRYIILNYSVRVVAGIKPVYLTKNGDENWYMVNFPCFLGKIRHFLTIFEKLQLKNAMKILKKNR